MRKILIVGGVAGGASAATRLRRLSEEDEIIMFERGPNVSFSNCSLPYHLSGVIEHANSLVMMNPMAFQARYRIDARVNQEVLKINRDEKTIRVKNLENQEIYEETYDILILSPGAKPIKPKIKGIESANVYTVRNVEDIIHVKQGILNAEDKNVAVIGGGYIGIEAAENLVKGGFHVTLIEAQSQVLKTFDYDMVQIFHRELYNKGVELILDDKVVEFKEDAVILESGKEVQARAVIMAIGITPETTLAKDAGLKIGSTGAIEVDTNYQTEDDSIYAIGDAIEVVHGVSGKASRISLAGPALKQARIVANHIHGKKTEKIEYLGSSAIRVFDYNGASTGLNENLIKDLGLQINYEKITFILNDKVSLMPDAHPLFFKLIYEKETGKILGAQAIGMGNVDKRIDVIATAMKFSATVEDLSELDLCYAPPFGTAKDIVNYAGHIGENLRDNDFKQVSVDALRGLIEDNAYILDVREEMEYNQGHIIGAINIPLSRLRERVDEIPKDKDVYVHCRTGQRSYNAVMALQHLGYDNVINVTGGFLGLSFYEFFDDIRKHREKVVTEYNFR